MIGSVVCDTSPRVAPANVASAALAAAMRGLRTLAVIASMARDTSPLVTPAQFASAALAAAVAAAALGLRELL